MDKKIRLMIVDDSAVYRSWLMNSLSKNDRFEIVGYAVDAFDAQRKIPLLKPDIVTLDIEMPGMSGIDFLKKLLPLHPVPVILVSSLSIKVIDALAAGAVDYVKKPDMGSAGEKEAFLTVTGQLHVEAFAMAFRDVYTFGPAFRAENSNTSRHASEFWMIEPEIAFADLEDDMDLIEDMVKYCIDYVLNNAPAEMEFFASMIDKDCINRITKVRNSDFKRMTYTEAIEILEKADVKFNNKVSWGMDLNSEHERYICEEVVKGPVFLTDYPKEIKAFYMRLNDDNKTVAACDLLVPGIGELVGGSQREERYDVLERIMDEKQMSKEGLQWYMDLRRFGGCKHAGFGLGFDRFLMYLTGMQNIRDVEPFPRTPRNLKF